MVASCHDEVSAELSDSLRDALIVGGNADIRQNFFCLPPYAFYHGHVANFSQGLARKSGRGVSCRNDANERKIVHIRFL